MADEARYGTTIIDIITANHRQRRNDYDGRYSVLSFGCLP